MKLVNGPNLLIKVEKLNVHKCEKCPRVFVNISDLINHKSYHENYFLSHVLSAYVSVKKAKIFKCETCFQDFDNNRDFMLHKLTHIQVNVRNERKINKLPVRDDIVKPYKCPQCDISYVAQSTLDAHSILHLPFPHVCECGIGYYQKQDLKSHIKLVHGNTIEADKEKLVIPQRAHNSKSKNVKKGNKSNKKGQKFKRKRKDFMGMQIKQEIDIPEPDIDITMTADGKFVCPECKKLFAARRNVILHYRTHSGERPYECHLCPKAFSQGITLRIHLKRHVSKEKIYVCKHCPKAFTMPCSRDRHELIHNSVKPYKCPFCAKRFHDPSACIRHKRIHTGDKRYRCPYCPKAFCDVSALIGHKLRHEKKKQYKCEICDKRFYNQSDVRKHNGLVHSEEKKFFTCDYCKRSYICKYNLMTHIMQIHMMVKQSCECECCHQKFSNKNNLKRHIKTKHTKYKYKLFRKLDDFEMSEKFSSDKEIEM